jgi:hypothetical protein
MTPAHIMDMASLHPGPVRRNHPAQIRNRECWAVFGDQAISVQPTAAVAPITGDTEHGQVVGDPAEGDDA